MGLAQVSRIAGRFVTVWASREAQEHWSGEPTCSPGDIPNPGIELGSPALQVDSLPVELPGKPLSNKILIHKLYRTKDNCVHAQLG